MLSLLKHLTVFGCGILATGGCKIRILLGRLFVSRRVASITFDKINNKALLSGQLPMEL